MSILSLSLSFQESPGYGADVLRLWVASVDYTGDVVIGDQILRQMSDIYRKLRGTVRYLLSNLHDFQVRMQFIIIHLSIPVNMKIKILSFFIFQPDVETVEYLKLPMIDKYALFQLANVMYGIKESYDSYQFYRFYQVN
jgi:isoleucyl-tRNA synthetase